MSGGRVHRRASVAVNDQSRWNSCKGARSDNQKAKATNMVDSCKKQHAHSEKQVYCCLLLIFLLY
jgi:hypothetical protein